ncbi:Zrt (ZRT), Irt-(IRT-) like Protein Transporter [Aphelenchoides fujianensis]|nr:Zrt (ZRT), Irt-(IRT-) like Protein Transporter [Aphelenchoides fujianensis]
MFHVLLAVALFIATCGAGMLPLRFFRPAQRKKTRERGSWLLTLSSCVAGGAFLAVCLLVILPDVRAKFVEYRSEFRFNGYPLPEFVACCSFFFIYLVEELVLKFFGKQQSKEKQPAPIRKNGSFREYPSLKIKTSSQGSLILPPPPTNDPTQDPTEGEEPPVVNQRRFSILNMHELVLDESVRFVADEKAAGGRWRSLVFLLSVGLHSLLEGVALGTQKQTNGIALLFCVLLLHKTVEAVGIGIQLRRAEKRLVVVGILAVYSFMTPLGSLLAHFLSTADFDPRWSGLLGISLEATAGGTFLFIANFGILTKERANEHSNLGQLGAVFFGFSFVSALLFWNQL